MRSLFADLFHSTPVHLPFLCFRYSRLFWYLFLRSGRLPMDVEQRAASTHAHGGTARPAHRAGGGRERRADQCDRHQPDGATVPTAAACPAQLDASAGLQPAADTGTRVRPDQQFLFALVSALMTHADRTRLSSVCRTFLQTTRFRSATEFLHSRHRRPRTTRHRPARPAPTLVRISTAAPSTTRISRRLVSDASCPLLTK